MKRSASITLLAVFLLASAAMHAQLTTDTVVLTTSDSKALGYVNNPKFTVDSNSIARFSVRTHDAASNYNNGLVQSIGPWSTATSFDAPVFLGASGSINPDAAAQRVASIALSSTAHTFMIWYGSDYADTSSSYSHQIHYADYDTTISGAPTISSEKVPVTISGFTTFYNEGTPYDDDTDYWQEHPSVAMDSGGKLYVVWEARDASHWSTASTQSAGGKLKPGIAFMTRTSSGTWSSTGTISTPPYMDITGISSSQSRPLILAPSTTLQHVLCYGSVSGTQQILYLDVTSGSIGTFAKLRANSNDQRHVSAALDPSGNTHAVWREGPIGGPVAVFYSERIGTGSWSTPVQVSASGSWASAPVVSADSSTVRIAFIQWTGGFKNSAGQTNNNITSTSNGDDDTVEGNLMFTSKPNGSGSFSTPVQLVTGYAAYPNFAVGAPNALIFQEWTTCGSNNFCSPQIHLGETH